MAQGVLLHNIGLFSHLAICLKAFKHSRQMLQELYFFSFTHTTLTWKAIFHSSFSQSKNNVPLLCTLLPHTYYDHHFVIFSSMFFNVQSENIVSCSALSSSYSGGAVWWWDAGVQVLESEEAAKGKPHYRDVMKHLTSLR